MPTIRVKAGETREIPLSRQAAKLAAPLLHAAFRADHPDGAAQMRDQQKKELVRNINAVLVHNGFENECYSTAKLDCWTANQLYRWRAAQKRGKCMPKPAFTAVCRANSVAIANGHAPLVIGESTAPKTVHQSDTQMCPSNTPPGNPHVGPYKGKRSHRDYSAEQNKTMREVRARYSAATATSPPLLTPRQLRSTPAAEVSPLSADTSGVELLNFDMACQVGCCVFHFLNYTFVLNRLMTCGVNTNAGLDAAWHPQRGLHARWSLSAATATTTATLPPPPSPIRRTLSAKHGTGAQP